MDKNSFEKIVQEITLMNSSLVQLKWQFFGKEAELIFQNDNEKSILKAIGIYLFQTRQELYASFHNGKIDMNCFVHFFDLTQESVFLKEFLNGKCYEHAKCEIYDSLGNKKNSGKFIMPIHIVIGADPGILDIICEKISYQKFNI